MKGRRVRQADENMAAASRPGMTVLHLPAATSDSPEGLTFCYLDVAA